MKWKIAAPLILFIATLAAYSNSFQTSFHFDDTVYITENPAIHIPDLSINSIWTLIAHPDTGRPLADVGFAINHYLSGKNILSYHVINYLIHLACSLLVFYLILLLFTALRSPGTKNNSVSNLDILAALSAALWWALLPVQTSAVTYIWQRITSATALGFLLGILGYAGIHLHPKNKWYWTAAIAGSLFAFGHKENAATLPIVMILFDAIFLCKMRWEEINRKLLKFGFLFGITIVLSFIYSARLGGVHPYHPALAFLAPQSMFQRLLTETRVIVYYLSLCFLPHPSRLMIDYAYPASLSLFNPPTTILSILLIMGLNALGFKWIKSLPMLSFGIFWFFGNCVLEAISHLSDVAFEYRLYLPSVGIAMALAFFLRKILEKSKPSLVLAPTACVLLTLCFWTWERNKAWATEITLWQDNVLKAPHNPRAFANLGLALANAQRQEESFPVYEKAIKLAPKYDLIYRNYGIALFSSGRIDEAIRQYEKSIELAPDEAETYYNVGYAYFAKSQWAQAIKAYQRGLQCPAPPPKLYLSLGNTQLRKGDYAAAQKTYQEGMALDPYNPFFPLRMGDIYFLNGAWNKALSWYQQAASLNPSNGMLQERVRKTAQYLLDRRRNPRMAPPPIVELPQYWGPAGER